MRRYHRLIAVLWLLSLGALAAFAADAPKEAPKETLADVAVRVQELGKANVVLHEDLARTRLQLDLTREALEKARADLTAEAAARQALESRLAEAQQQTARDITRSDEALKKELMDAVQLRLAAVEKSIEALNTRHGAELAAAKQSYDQKLASLQDALDKETAARLALEESTAAQVARVEKQQKQDRTWGWALGGLNLGVSIFK
ncbi:MAG: hypothetical protein HY321_06685 [Armatimonadetes bacterium]|nr:hypothetical protein [Armatimonadota bacterium]